MMKLNQSMNSNYGSAGDNGQQQMLLKKHKKKKSQGANGIAKTPLDFESSMSSNSALLMMDGGTGSEHINFRHPQGGHQ
jgi:hypothetical protein